MCMGGGGGEGASGVLKHTYTVESRARSHDPRHRACRRVWRAADRDVEPSIHDTYRDLCTAYTRMHIHTDTHICEQVTRHQGGHQLCTCQNGTEVNLATTLI